MNKTIYIYMDDSGKMTKNEKCFSFGGIYFLNRESRDSFKRLYSSFINENKERFLDDSSLELKSNNTNSKFRRRVINLIKNKNMVYSYAITIFTKNIEDYIFSNKKSKGRRIDYYQKIIVKKIIKNLLLSKTINKKDNLTIIINIDESKTATNGIYNLRDSIFEELKNGIVNFNYGTSFPPIIEGNLEVEVNYVDSSKNFLVQASDFLVGYVNASFSWNKEVKLSIDSQIIL